MLGRSIANNIVRDAQRSSQEWHITGIIGLWRIVGHTTGLHGAYTARTMGIHDGFRARPLLKNGGSERVPGIYTGE